MCVNHLLMMLYVLFVTQESNKRNKNDEQMKQRDTFLALIRLENWWNL